MANNMTWEEQFEEKWEDEFTVLDKQAIKQFISSLLKEQTEKARQEGYEVGFAQADSGMPKPMIEFIKQERDKEWLSCLPGDLAFTGDDEVDAHANGHNQCRAEFLKNAKSKKLI